MTKRVDIIVGARPNFVKAASILRAIREQKKLNSSCFDFRLIHTGQHYDKRMSDDFFEQLGIPDPDVNLGVGSGTQAQQTAAIMIGYEKLLLNNRSDICLVVGDVNSTMACALAAQKLGVKVAHVEAGIRSLDWTMPEEINRLVTDAISNWYFTTSRSASDNLLKSGVSGKNIYFVGNTMIDTLLENMPRFCPPNCWGDLGLKSTEYLVLTLHRPSNVDDPESLIKILDSIKAATRGLPIIFPVHPRTKEAIMNLKLPENIHVIDSQPYLQFNYLVKHAKAVITDSGGITEEATIMGIPCLTMRNSTERPETIEIGSNVLVGQAPGMLKYMLDKLFIGQWKTGGVPEKWDGRAGERIVQELQRLLKTIESPLDLPVP